MQGDVTRVTHLTRSRTSSMVSRVKDEHRAMNRRPQKPEKGLVLDDILHMGLVLIALDRPVPCVHRPKKGFTSQHFTTEAFEVQKVHRPKITTTSSDFQFAFGKAITLGYILILWSVPFARLC